MPMRVIGVYRVPRFPDCMRVPKPRSRRTCSIVSRPSRYAGLTILPGADGPLRPVVRHAGEELSHT
jgi:hypothetical protein